MSNPEKTRVLFVSRQYKPGIPSPIVEEQARSLEEFGLDVQKFLVSGGGPLTYLKAIPELIQHIKEFQPDVLHAHYSFSGVTAYLAFRGPVVCSLMGSDVFAKTWYRLVLKVFSKWLWKSTIVKSEPMRQALRLFNAQVVPNGVDMKKFSPTNQGVAQQTLKWDSDCFHVLFPAVPAREVKNFALAKAAFDLFPATKKELHVLADVSHDEMPGLFNASDVVLLTSRYEGSPNVIKEAAACNRPIVTTNVGDVMDVIGKATGCIIVDQESAQIISDSLEACAKFNHSDARKYIPHLSHGAIAAQLKAIYQTAINAD